MPRPPEVRVLASAEEVARAGAAIIQETAQHAARKHGRFTLALSGGSTPRATYELLAQPVVAATIDWSIAHLFWSDERCVGPDDPASNYRMVKEALLDRVPVPESQVHRMRGELPVPAEAARHYAVELQRVFGKSATPRFDLMLLGLGEDGHTASLFPGVPVPADGSTLAAAVYVPQVQMWRLTLTLPVINAAAHVLFLVTGDKKRAALRALAEGPRSLDLPAQRVQPTHGQLTILADHAASSDSAL